MNKKISLKDKLKSFLKKLEKVNKESFGNERLDCCKLNKK